MRTLVGSGMLKIIALGCLLAGCYTARGADNLLSQPLQPVLCDYKARLTGVRTNLASIIAAAEFAANQVLDYPGTLPFFPYAQQQAIGEELQGRAGGLAHAVFDNPTNPVVVFLSVRSWQEDGDQAVKLLERTGSKGWPAILLASKAGAPENILVKYFLDNGAPSGGKEHGNVNALINATIAWIWCCEYYSAMSRRFLCPAIMKGAGLPGGSAFNHLLFTPEYRNKPFPCPTAIPAGELASVYLKRVDQLLRDMESAAFQDRLVRAADIVAGRMAQGGIVGLGGYGHMIIFEPRVGTVAPWKQVNLFWKKHAAMLPKVLKPGDLLVWFGYIGMGPFSEGVDHAGIDLVSAYAKPEEKDFIPPKRQLLNIEQPWGPVDAIVPIPTAPGVMAPISGLSTTLTLRMLDDEVTRRLAIHTKPVDAKSRLDNTVSE